MADMTDLPDGDDELDIDGLDDINFDSPEFGGEDNRDPITRFKAAAVDSALDPDTYVGVTRAIAKNALPREYSEAYNSVEDTLKFITDTGRETADKVKKPINDLRDFVTDTIEEMDDSGNETIEKIKKTVLGLTSREREGSDEHSRNLCT
jgi:gas vesicle protein